MDFLFYGLIARGTEFSEETKGLSNVHNVHKLILYGKRRSQRSQILHKGNILYFSIEKL